METRETLSRALAAFSTAELSAEVSGCRDIKNGTFAISLHGNTVRFASKDGTKNIVDQFQLNQSHQCGDIDRSTGRGDVYTLSISLCGSKMTAGNSIRVRAAGALAFAAAKARSPLKANGRRVVRLDEMAERCHVLDRAFIIVLTLKSSDLVGLTVLRQRCRAAVRILRLRPEQPPTRGPTASGSLRRVVFIDSYEEAMLQGLQQTAANPITSGGLEGDYPRATLCSCVELLHQAAGARPHVEVSRPVGMSLSWKSIGDATPLPGRHGAVFHSSATEAAGGKAATKFSSKGGKQRPDGMQIAEGFAGGEGGAVWLTDVNNGECATAAALPVAMTAGIAMRAFPVRLRVLRRRVDEDTWQLDLSIAWDPVTKVAIAAHLATNPEAKAMRNKLKSAKARIRFVVIIRALQADATFELAEGTVANGPGAAASGALLVWQCDTDAMLEETPKLSATLRGARTDAGVDVYCGADAPMPTASRLAIRYCRVYSNDRNLPLKLTGTKASALTALVTLPHPDSDESSADVGGYVCFLNAKGEEERTYLTGSGEQTRM